MPIRYLTGASNPEVRSVAKERGIGILLRPGNSYHRHAGAYPFWAADNGQYTTKPEQAPTEEAWWSWLRGIAGILQTTDCLFATAPDVLTVTGGVVAGDARATLERSGPWLPRIRGLGLPAALVAQDGLEELPVPWGSFDVLFVGGSTAWKLSVASQELMTQARRRGVRVHVGRVNSYRRLVACAKAGAESADGTFLAFGPKKNLPKLLRWLDRLEHLAPSANGARTDVTTIACRKSTGPRSVGSTA